jgi:hypothetical protein
MKGIGVLIALCLFLFQIVLSVAEDSDYQDKYTSMPARFPEVEVHGPVGGRGTVESLEVGGAPRGWGSGDDDVVITGLSGRFPESNNIEEFAEQLFAGVDLITDDERRWPSGKAERFHTIEGIFR